MKKVLIVLGVLIFASCSKKDCVCVSTSSENGVVISTSTSSSSGSSGLGPAGNATDEASCDFGDSSYSYSSGGTSYSDVTECELE